MKNWRSPSFYVFLENFEGLHTFFTELGHGHLPHSGPQREDCRDLTSGVELTWTSPQLTILSAFLSALRETRIPGPEGHALRHPSRRRRIQLDPHPRIRTHGSTYTHVSRLPAAARGAKGGLSLPLRRGAVLPAPAGDLCRLRSTSICWGHSARGRPAG